MSTVGERIKSRRLELQMSQDELAKKCGYKSRSSINKIECSRELPLKKVKAMALALDVSFAYLMGWEEPNSPMGELLELNKNNEGVKAIFNGIHATEKLDNEEIKLLEAWRACDDEGKKRIMDLITYMIDKKS